MTCKKTDRSKEEGTTRASQLPMVMMSILPFRDKLRAELAPKDRHSPSSPRVSGRFQTSPISRGIWNIACTPIRDLGAMEIALHFIEAQQMAVGNKCLAGPRHYRALGPLPISLLVSL